MQEYTQRKETKKPNQTGIPDGLKNQYESLSGLAFDDVKVHYNSEKPATMQALAYTQGNQVHVGPGQEKHLEHELGHVIQQKAGMVKATGMINGVPVNTDPALERSADSILKSGAGCNRYNNEPVVQRYEIEISENKDGIAVLWNTIQAYAKEILRKYEIGDSDENTEVLLKILYPEPFAWKNVKNTRDEKIKTRDEKIKTRDEKIEARDKEIKSGIADSLKEDQNKGAYIRYLCRTLDRLDRGAKELHDDVEYWREKIESNPDDFSQITGIKKGTAIKELVTRKISLTGSDLHERGLGAAFVSFQVYYKGFFNELWSRIRGGTLFEIVLKPDQRVIEERLLSDNKESLASKFNDYEWSYDEEDISKEGYIETIPMKASSSYRWEDNEKGTIIKKMVGEQCDIHEAPLNLYADIKAIVFASLAGITDLHQENVRYGAGAVPQLIDADVALNRELLGNIRRTGNQEGFPADGKNDAEGRTLGRVLGAELSLDKGIIKDIKDAFRGKYVRIVPIATAALQDDRYRFVFIPTGRKRLIEGRVESLKRELKKMIGAENFAETVEETQLKRDYSQGQIPIYLYHCNNGKVTHNGKVIASRKNADQMIDAAYEKHGIRIVRRNISVRDRYSQRRKLQLRHK